MLLPKPKACKGCPFYGDGQGFVPDEIKPEAEVLLMFQGPGRDEEEGRRLVSRDPHTYEPHPHAPVLGATGLSLDQDFLPLTGLSRSEVSLANPLRCRYQHRNDLPEEALTKAAIYHCQNAYWKLPPKVKLIVASGEWALWAMAGEGFKEVGDEEKGRSLTAWRGYVVPYNPPPRPMMVYSDMYLPSQNKEPSVLATYHVAHQWGAPELWPAMRRDWQKVAEILAGVWPKPMPPITLEPPQSWPTRSGFDTEFSREDGHLIRYSLTHTQKNGVLRVHVVESQLAWQVPTAPGSVVEIHNLPADIGFLNNLTGGVPLRAEDTMLKHAILWSDLPHNLNFVGSIYSRLNRWKHLEQHNPIVYAAGDAVGALDAGHNLNREMTQDPRARKVYYDYRLPQWAIISKGHQRGIRVNQDVAGKAVAELSLTMADALAKARAVAGWNINLASAQQVTHWLYDYEEVHRNGTRPVGSRIVTGLAKKFQAHPASGK